MKLKGLVKQFLLNNFTKLSRVIFKNQILIVGDHSNWEDAKSLTLGYEDKNSTSTSLEALKARFSKNKKSFERDGFIMKDDNKNLFLSNSIKSAFESNRRIKILDFGGGFGSLYFNNKSELPESISKNWLIFELETVVKKSRKVKELRNLNYTSSWTSALKNTEGRFVIFSGVLQYLKNPKITFEKILKMKPEYVFIDRTPFLNDGGLNNKLCIQINPEILGFSSYPVWLFNNTFLSSLLKKYRFIRVLEFESIDKLSHMATWRGEFWVNENHKIKKL